MFLVDSTRSERRAIGDKTRSNPPSKSATICTSEGIVSTTETANICTACLASEIQLFNDYPSGLLVNTMMFPLRDPCNIALAFQVDEYTCVFELIRFPSSSKTIAPDELFSRVPGRRMTFYTDQKFKGRLGFILIDLLRLTENGQRRHSASSDGWLNRLLR